MAFANVLACLVTALVCGSGGVQAYNVGAPYSACESMMPAHGAAGSAGNPGYTFSHDMCQGYQAGKLYFIRIQGPRFKGFFCRVQKKGTVSSRNAMGKWDVRYFPSLTRASSCATPSTGVTHLSVDRPWTNIEFAWKAPARNEGILQIACTMVRSRAVFYVALPSGDIHFNPSTALIPCRSPRVYVVAKPPTAVTPAPATSVVKGSSCTQTCPAGPPGPKGAQGSTGRQGSQGQSGTHGWPGQQGSQGQTGAKGASGSPGATGSSGRTGSRGQKGASGSRGYSGARGPPGPPGATTSTTGSGTSVPGPRGPKGDRGDAGRRGTQGYQGGAGDTGPPGVPGPLGLPGRTGPKGREGDAGSPGGRGHKGAPGQAAVVTGPSTAYLSRNLADLAATVQRMKTDPTTARMSQVTELEYELLELKTTMAGMKEQMKKLSNGIASPPPDCPDVSCPTTVQATAAPPKVCRCRSPLGMQNGSITNSRIRASSSRPGHEAREARLNVGSTWIPQNSEGAYLDIYFPRTVSVTGVILEGMAGAPYWVTKYTLAYRATRSSAWTTVTQDGGTTLCQGNKSSDKAAVCVLDCDAPIRAAAVRIYPTGYHTTIAMRAEILGC